MICPGGKPICSFSLMLLGAGWFLLALFVGETELLSLLPGAATPVILLGITATLLGAFWGSQAFRAWVDQVELKYLVAVHLTRFVGIYFLVLHGRGELPGRFAISAGWGDILVATGAALLLLVPGLLKSQRAVLGWNCVGLIDILFVVATAAGLVAADRESMSALTRLPLSFLPTVVVPLIISTHVVMMIRLFRKQEVKKGVPVEFAERAEHAEAKHDVAIELRSRRAANEPNSSTLNHAG